MAPWAVGNWCALSDILLTEQLTKKYLKNNKFIVIVVDFASLGT